MPVLELTAVEGTFCYSDPNAVSVAQRDAASNIRLFVQAGAREMWKKKYNREMTPDDYRTEEWFENYCTVITKDIPLVEIVEGSGGFMTRHQDSGSIDFRALITAALAVYLPATMLADWEKIVEALTGDLSDGVTDFMNFWWSHAEVSESRTNVSVSPTFITSDQEVAFNVSFCSFDLSIDEWRSLFVSSNCEAFDSGSTGMKFKFNMDKYNEFKGKIEERLDPVIATSIMNTPLDFG